MWARHMRNSTEHKIPRQADSDGSTARPLVDASHCAGPSTRTSVRGANPSSLVDKWVEFLSPVKWEWFCTFTFRDDIHPEGADKAFRFLMAKLNRKLFGPRWYRKGESVQYVRALEYQKRGVIHFHALLAGVGGADRFSVMEQWDELAGFARIYPPCSSDAVTRYCAKYVAKGGELEVSGGPWGFEPLSFGQPGGRDSAPRSLGFFVGDSTPDWWGEVDRDGHVPERRMSNVPRVLSYARCRP